MPTRLLDWSNNPLAALFFAVSIEPDKDGELFIMDAYQLAKDQNAKISHNEDFKGIATKSNPVFEDAIKTIFSWGKVEAFPNFIIPVRPDFLDKRMSLQKSCFTFHVPNPHTTTLTQKHNHTLASFNIPKDSKPKLKKDLATLGIDHFNIYGDFEGLSKTLKTNYFII